MADTQKVLGQVAPAATTLTTLYTVPAATSTVVSTIVVCNTTANTDKFRVSIQVGGAADNVKQYLYYDVSIQANDTFTATIGATLATTDVVKVYSTSGNLSFAAFGVEIT